MCPDGEKIKYRVKYMTISFVLLIIMQKNSKIVNNINLSFATDFMQ